MSKIINHEPITHLMPTTKTWEIEISVSLIVVTNTFTHKRQVINYSVNTCTWISYRPNNKCSRTCNKRKEAKNLKQWRSSKHSSPR